MYLHSYFTHLPFKSSLPLHLQQTFLLRRSFHTSPKRQLHPLFWFVLKPLAKLTAALSGRGFRKWWQNLPKDKRKLFQSAVKRNVFKLSAGTTVIAGCSYVYYLNRLQETPITKRKRFVAFTEEQFREIADLEFKAQFEMYRNQLLPWDNPAYVRLSRVAERLLAANKDIQHIYGKNWTITVVDDPQQNAFVLPNGQIFFFRGMVQFCYTDDQLGVVLAHEMAHSILSHGAEQISFAHLLDMAVVILVAAIWAILPSDSLALFTQWLSSKIISIVFHLPYSRKLETEADEVGLQLAAKACFDVRESSAFWTRMAIQNEVKGEIEIPWLSTHPTHNDRSVLLDALMEKALELRTSCKCPKLASVDPRIEIELFKKQLEKSRKESKTDDPEIEKYILKLYPPEKRN